MSIPVTIEAVDHFFKLCDEVLLIKDLDILPDTVLPQVSQFSDENSAFLYVTTPQLFTPLFLEQGMSADTIEQLKESCTNHLDRLANMPPTATTPRSWKAEGQYTVFPLRDGFDYVGLLGISLGTNALPISPKLWDRYLQVLASTIHRLVEQHRSARQLAHLNTYMTVSSMLAQTMGLREIMETALYCCMEVVSAETATVLLLDDDRENFIFYQVEGPTKPVLKPASFPVDQGIAGSILQSGMSEVINDVANDPRFYKKIDEKSGYQTRNMIVLPLAAGEEQVGILEVLNKNDGKDFTEEEHLALMMIAEEISFAVRNAKIFEYVVDSYCKQRQGLNSCAGCERPLGSWTPCIKYREELL